MQNGDTSYILNRVSIVELYDGNNTVYCQNEIISLNEIDNERLPLFQIRNIGDVLVLIPISNCIVYVNEIVVEKEIVIHGTTSITTSNNAEFIVFKVCINPLIEIVDEQEILVHFIETGEMSKGSGFDLLKFLNNGADKLQIDEFFSIVAQVDVPEIDQ